MKIIQFIENVLTNTIIYNISYKFINILLYFLNGFLCLSIVTCALCTTSLWLFPQAREQRLKNLVLLYSFAPL